MASKGLPNDLIRSHFVTYWGQKVLVQIFKYNFLHEEGKTIYDILTDQNVNLLGRRSRLTSVELQKVKSNVPLENLDITILFKICSILWDIGFQVPSVFLRDSLKRIKDERNRALHEHSPLSQQELFAEMTDFREILQNALDEAANIYSHRGANFDFLKIQIQEALQQLENLNYIMEHEQEVGAVKDSIHNDILETIREELRDVYRDLCKILPFDWLYQYGVTEPSEILVSLKMKLDQNLHPNIPNKHHIVLDQDEMLKFKYPHDKDPKVVILTGNTGSGKTTFLSFIVEDWCEGKDAIINLSTFQTLLYMQFSSHDHDSFDEYLKDRLQRSLCDFSISKVKASLLNSKCLILCDGYDEVNAKSKKLFESFLRFNCKEKKIVVTTRPVKVEEITNFINQSKFTRINLNLLGVPLDLIGSHIKKVTKYLKTDETERNELHSKLARSLEELDDKTGQILENPLWLNLFVLLCTEYPAIRGKIINATMLYILLDEHKIERLINKLNINKNKASELDKFYREQSLRYYLQDKYELSQEDTDSLEAKCHELGLNFDSVMSTYFNIRHIKRGLNVVKMFYYRHRSEQEFAAASIICDELEICHNKSLIGNIKEERENVIDQVLTSLDIRCNPMGQDYDSYNRWELISSLMILITSILYNTDRTSVLYAIIDDLIAFKSRRANANHSSSRKFQDLLMFSVETSNDSKIVSAVARLYDKLFVKNESTLQLQDPRILSSLPSFISKQKAKKIHLQFKDITINMSESLISTLDAANRHGVKINLDFSCAGFRDLSKYIIRAKSCIECTGSLTKEGIEAIPICMESMLISVDLKEIKTLSLRLQDLKNLRKLNLLLSIDESVDILELTCLNNPIKEFDLQISTNLDMEDESSVYQLASVINKIWPPNPEGLSDHIHNLLIETQTPGFTVPAVKLLGKQLTVRPLTVIILDPKEEVREAEMKLQFFYQEQGLKLICS